ncbi:MAG: hypothetical protein H7175_09005 [Burkholderiales bacterium]|nr:hypothetical protein [Anaerolineae bacterium]
MGDTFRIVFLLVLNVLLLACGPIVIRRRRVSFGFGRGSKPAFTVTLTGTGALAFGIATLVGGIIAVIPTLMFISSKDSAALEAGLTISIAVALILMFGGLMIGAVFQLLEELEATARKE